LCEYPIKEFGHPVAVLLRVLGEHPDVRDGRLEPPLLWTGPPLVERSPEQRDDSPILPALNSEERLMQPWGKRHRIN
jgi:hypothetical protein